MSFMVNSSVFRAFAFYGGVLTAKTLVMAFVTARKRKVNKAFNNREDVSCFSSENKDSALALTDPEVERVRNAHRNDMENIFAYFFIGALYVTTEPNHTWAVTLFRVFTGARIIHTLVYLRGLQPARLIAFLAAMGVNLYMTAAVIVHYY